jgi:ubiquinone/menaquinone biosynthesis C-methylase UbiE
MEQIQQPIGVIEAIEEEFRHFLHSDNLENQGFSLSKKLSWAKYMQDLSRPITIVHNLFSDLNISSQEKNRALDIGCGFGGLLIALQPHYQEVYGIDINQTFLEWSQKRATNAKVIYANAKQLPWSENYFDLICATDMFEHINYEEQDLAASELMRVLKPGGHGVIIVPNRFQILDEHNKVFFGTWLPTSKRQFYLTALSQNKTYDYCWERTGKGWQHLFEIHGFEVTITPHYMKGWNFLKYLLVPANRYKLYIKKPEKSGNKIPKTS